LIAELGVVGTTTATDFIYRQTGGPDAAHARCGLRRRPATYRRRRLGPVRPMSRPALLSLA
jgi:hypothetical protein